MANQDSRRFAATAACAALVIASLPAAAQPTLDPTFGTGGKVFIDFGPSDTPNALLRQPDGNVVIGGYARFAGASDAIALSRHLPDGGFDPGFASGGKLVRQYTYRDQLNGMTLQPDGKIVAVGIRSESSAWSGHTASIYRFNSDGSTDSTFSDDGWTSWRFDAVSSGQFFSVKVLPDGKILAVGCCNTNANGGQNGTAAMRFLPNGELDPSYGIKLFPLSSLIFVRGQAAFLEDGGFIYASQRWLGGETWEFVLLRVDGSGERVTSFGSGGYAFGGFSTLGSNYDTSIAVLPDGRILVAGTTSYVPPSQRQYTVVRFDPNGAIDPTFGDAGRADVRIGLQNDLFGLHVAPNGKILLVGTAALAFGPPARAGLARLNPDGTPDNDFAPGGSFSIDLLPNNSNFLRQTLVDDDGRILSSGKAGNDNVLTRFTPPVAEVGAPISSGEPLFTSIAPNPTRATSRIEFTLDRPDRVRLSVIDPTGRRIRTLADRTFAAGSAWVSWDGRGDDGRSVPPGVYFAHLTTEGNPVSTTSRVVVLR